MKTIASLIREKRLSSTIRESEMVYQSGIGDIEGYQLTEFNKLWADIQRNVPYYQKLVQSGSVPREIKEWDDFTKLPIMTRSSIQEDVTRYIDHTQEITGWTTTGGSTGAPFRVPHGKFEAKPQMLGAWLGRRFYDIRPSDRMFHLWGHSHLFGIGWQRYVKQTSRKIKNWLLGYQVFSAYHLTPERLRQAGQAIIKMQPDFIMGYSRSLVLLARVNEDQSNAFHKLPIKAIIATTEAFSQVDDVEYIEKVFGCPVGMEYGAAETGVIAYTHPSDQRYKAFWDTYLLEAVPVNQTDAKLLLTALYPRAMPLIRYDIGDTVRNYDAVENSVLSFETVLGRDNDLIDIGGGAFVHPVALIHCVQYQLGVLGVQILQEKDNTLSIYIMCKSPLSTDAEISIRRNLSTLDPKLSECKIFYVDRLEQTVAGKTKWIIRK